MRSVEDYLGAASGTLDILLDPPPQARQVENVTASQLPGEPHFLQANDASCINPLPIRRHLQIHTRETLELFHQGARFNEQLDRFVEFDKSIKALAEQVEWELAAREQPEEEAAVQD